MERSECGDRRRSGVHQDVRLLRCLVQPEVIAVAAPLITSDMAYAVNGQCPDDRSIRPGRQAPRAQTAHFARRHQVCPRTGNGRCFALINADRDRGHRHATAKPAPQRNGPPPQAGPIDVCYGAERRMATHGRQLTSGIESRPAAMEVWARSTLARATSSFGSNTGKGFPGSSSVSHRYSMLVGSAFWLTLETASVSCSTTCHLQTSHCSKRRTVTDQ